VDNVTPIRKPYKKPQVTKLTLEQAKLRLLGRSSEGNEGANDLLRLMFPEAAPQAEKNKKKQD
jgi:hypothetical protein